MGVIGKGGRGKERKGEEWKYMCNSIKAIKKKDNPPRNTSDLSYQSSLLIDLCFPDHSSLPSSWLKRTMAEV